FVECGPGAVLTGLAKRINRELSGLNTDNPEKMATAVTAVG
ncbi:MAG: malonyl CoA-acyl carrier protein transacylase, partial [Halieaceae bacterium]